MHQKHSEEFKWLCYSSSKEGFFCKYCVLFGPFAVVGAANCNQSAGKLVKTPLTTFSKLTGKDGALSRHASSNYHKNSLQAAQIYKISQKDPASDIRNQLSSQRQLQVRSIALYDILL